MNAEEKGKKSSKVIANEKRKLISYASLLLVATIFLLFMVINNVLWVSGIIFLLPLYYYSIKKYLDFRTMKKVLQLQKQWGQNIKKDRDFQAIRLLFDNDIMDNEYIDEQTWQDLNMDQVYAKIDQTLTSPGETVLYNLLRKPLFSIKELVGRDRIITVFQGNSKLREQVGLHLLKLGRQKENVIVNFLWGDIPAPTRFGMFFNLMALLSLLIFISFFFIKAQAIFLLVLVMTINMGIIRYFKNKYFYHLPTNIIRYLVTLIKTADKLAGLDIELPAEYQTELQELGQKVNKLLRNTSNILPQIPRGEVDIIYQYLNVFFLLEVRGFNAALFEINKHREELKRIFIIVGEIDALRSAASYRETLNYYTFPELNSDWVHKNLIIEGNYHPLLENPVTNTVEMNNKGIIITGSNMAGKSTFLRTVGINVLLAQTIGTCLARNYRGTMFRVISSISRTDNILTGKSFYYSEAERLLDLVNTIQDRLPSLCIIDEMLSGTNSLERLAASQEILDYLDKNNVLSLVATHDLKLAEMLQDQYACYHFTDNVTKDGLDFDYTLKKGIAVTANAIKLLEFLDFPAEITNKAFDRVRDSLEDFIKGIDTAMERIKDLK